MLEVLWSVSVVVHNHPPALELLGRLPVERDEQTIDGGTNVGRLTDEQIDR